MRKLWLLVAAVAVAGLLWFWLGRGGSGGSDGDPVAFVPQDTPYVFANLEPIPNAIVTKSLRQTDAYLALWRRQISSALKALETPASGSDDDDASADAADALADADENAEETDAEAAVDAEAESEAPAEIDAKSRRFAAWLRAIDAELATAPDARALLTRLGLDPSQLRTALYGIGLVPVSRTTLADPAAFKALVARLEQATGETFPRIELPGLDAGWRIAVPEAPIHGVVAIAQGHLVITLAPPQDSDALRVLLGLERPARSILDSGALVTLNRKEGFTAFGSGFIDTAALVAQLRTPATPLETAFLKPLELEKPTLPPECETDVARLVQAFPRMIAGYTRMDAGGMETLSLLETSPSIAQDLVTLRAPMPGLASASDALGSFGVAIKVSALPALGNRWGAAAAASPWTCPALSWINEAAAQARTGLSNPALFAAGPVINSVLVAVDRFSFDLSTQRPTDLAARLIIGSDNPASLVGTARTFVPQLASLKLEPGAAPQPIPDELLMGAIEQPAFVAMGEGALGLAVGEGEAQRLPGYLRADPAAQPLLHVRYRGAAMVEGARLMREAVALLPEPAREDLMLNAQLIEDVYSKQIEALEMSIGFTDRGIELRQRIEQKP